MRMQYITTFFSFDTQNEPTIYLYCIGPFLFSQLVIRNLSCLIHATVGAITGRNAGAAVVKAIEI